MVYSVLLVIFLSLKKIHSFEDVLFDEDQVGSGSGSGPPVNGGFSEWKSLTECSVTCGEGTRKEFRECNNPPPSNGGDDCIGEAIRTMTCNRRHCPINGGYTDWSSYSQCSATCGGGFQERRRTCTNPHPQFGGLPCAGPSREVRMCNTHICNVDGGWGEWAPFSKCSSPCGGGIQKRYRSCNNPPPKGNGKWCAGANNNIRICNTQTCPTPPPINTATICEGSQDVLKCENNRRIQISTVFWGRATNSICKKFGNFGKCSNKGAHNIVKNKCNGKTQCTIYAKEKYLGKGGCYIWVNLYFQATYLCITPPRPTTIAPTTTPSNKIKTRVCAVKLVFCQTAGYVMKNVVAVYTNQVAGVCFPDEAQTPTNNCVNDITQYIRPNCEKQPVCVVQVNKTIHANGCHGNGYIDMEYECKPADGTNPQTTTPPTTPTTVPGFIKRQVCEERSGIVSCSGGTVIDIKYAFFGRKDKNVCKLGNHWNTDQCSTDAIKLVKYSCQNKTFCFVNADAGQLGDPCPSTSKYLEFQYECVPKGTATVATELFIPSVPLATRQPFQTQNPVFQQCGVSHIQSSRVIGGSTPPKGKFPWQVAIYKNKAFTCGGSLLSSTLIVTAAHCLVDKTPEKYYVILGEHDRTTIDGDERRYEISDVIVHYKYEKDYYSPIQHDNDIALLRLKRPVEFTKYISPICLPDGDHVVGEQCFISGWGKATFPGKMNGILQHTAMPIVDTYDCKETLKKAPGKPGDQITNNMFCAGDVSTNNSGCHGDSGGPFVCLNKFGKWVLRGVVSWGSPRCEIKDMYLVLTKVTQYKQWINWYLYGRM